MLGWWITISTRFTEGEPAEDRRAAQLSQWETGLGGTQWIDRLVEAGLAQQVQQGGYPSRYTARWADVLPMLGERGALIKATRNGPLQWHAERIAACDPEHVVAIEVWDLS